MARVIRTFTATVQASDISRVVSRLSNRELSQRMRRAGEEANAVCNEKTHQFEPRYDDRRRYPGSPEIADSISVRYSGLDQIQGGQMAIRLETKAPSFWFLEFGTPPHEIRPAPGKRLAWPGTLLPIDFPVQHPGSTRFRGTFRQTAARAMRDRFPGIKIPLIQ